MFSHCVYKVYTMTIINDIVYVHNYINDAQLTKDGHVNCIQLDYTMSL